jgi:hypothetical protein
VTKPPPKSGDVVPIKPQLPAVVVSNPFRAFDKFTEDADSVLRRYRQIEDLLGTVRDAVERGRTDELVKLFADAKRRAMLSEYAEQHLLRCREALQTFDAAENYEDDDREFGDLRPSVIALRIAAMLDSNPYGKPRNPEAYITMLVERVIGIEVLTLPALQAACNEISDEREFLPSLATVLKALRKHQALWDERLSAIRNLADVSHRAVAKIEALEIEAREANKKTQRAAKARAAEQARYKLKQAERDVIEAEDNHCEASAALRESEEAFARATSRMLECKNELARIELARTESEQDEVND